MAQHETDYLVIGAGAAGLAFADTLLQETDAHITIVDRHGRPGGHWNDAYPFVALHQPSAFYGVNSLPLGTLRKDTAGPNAGHYELASGAEVSGYFHNVMYQQLLPTGRVSYHAMSDYLGDGKFVSMLSGEQTQVNVRKKVVDASYFGTTVPSTHTPKFSVAPGVQLVTPTGLTQLWQRKGLRPTRFCILGAGKTAMDVGVWLLGCGARADAISWVMPRDSWLVNRATTQPGEEFFSHSIGGQALAMKALAEATSVDDLFLRLEASRQMLRIDPNQTPRMFHYATISIGEVELLRQIKNVIRRGHVRSINANAMTFDDGEQTMHAETLYIDCTASAVEPKPMIPIFQDGKITLQLVRAPLVSFSVAMIAYVEAHYADDAQKNQLCGNVPFPKDISGWIETTAANMRNQMQWSQDKTLRKWMVESRLDGFGKLVASVAPTDTEKMKILGELRSQSGAAMANAPKLLAAWRATNQRTA
ncbi:MAG: NAD(P)/FAD-dependent oxidoreductase [Betaproteobacteria bacterium]|nr:MAG: NAD(P)/FAD-dependent oxidoreductase [Betaproteobacteria bacterium]